MPKRDDKYMAAKRREVLIGAMRCFAERGFDGTTIGDICEKAGLSVGVIYRHFKSKRDIILALPELSTEIRDDHQPETPEELWSQIFWELDEILKVDPNLLRLHTQLLLESARDDDLKVIFSKSMQSRRDYILACLHRFQSNGLLQEGYDIEVGAHALLLMNDGGHMRLLSDSPEEVSRYKQCLAREFFLMTGEEWSEETQVPNSSRGTLLAQALELAS